MSRATPPTISAVVAAYNSESYLEEALESVLGQTRPPDEIVVVDDGSTDRTPEILAGYGDRIRVIRQENAGYPAAMNRAIAESTGDFVAPIGADDIWEPRKLEWQVEALEAHPTIEVHFAHAVFFGTVVGDHVRPTGTGLLANHQLWQDFYRVNVINTPSVLLDRRLFARIGWFSDRFLADDYEFFFNCLRDGVVFYYEPRACVRYRRHDNNITKSNAELLEAMVLVRSRNADKVDDRQMVDRMLATDLFKIGRCRVDEGRPDEARRAFARALRHRRGAGPSTIVRALAWLGILALPDAVRRRVGFGFVAASRVLDGVRGGRPATLP